MGFVVSFPGAQDSTPADYLVNNTYLSREEGYEDPVEEMESDEE